MEDLKLNSINNIDCNIKLKEPIDIDDDILKNNENSVSSDYDNIINIKDDIIQNLKNKYKFDTIDKISVYSSDYLKLPLSKRIEIRKKNNDIIPKKRKVFYLKDDIENDDKSLKKVKKKGWKKKK